VASAAWTPDGERIALAGFDGTVHVLGRDGKPQVVMTGHIGPVRSVAWSPDGNRLASASSDTTVRLWSAGGTVGPVLKGHTIQVNAVAWSPNAKLLASADSHGEIRLWEADGKTGPILKGHTNVIWSVGWNPDSTLLASASFDQTVRIWRSDGTCSKVLAQRGDSPPPCANWSPDGKWLASGSCYDEKIRLWRPDGTPGPILQAAFGTLAIAWSPDSQWLAAPGKDYGIVLVQPDGKHGRLFAGHYGVPLSIAWSSRKMLAAGTLGGTVVAWDTETREPLWAAVLVGDGKSVTFSADGKVLHGDPEIIERELVCLIEKPDGSMEILKPSEFQKRVADLSPAQRPAKPETPRPAAIDSAAAPGTASPPAAAPVDANKKGPVEARKKLAEEMIGWYDAGHRMRMTILPDKDEIVCVIEWGSAAPCSVGKITFDRAGKAFFSQPADKVELTIDRLRESSDVSSILLRDFRFKKLAGLGQAVGSYVNKQNQRMVIARGDGELKCSIDWGENAPLTIGCVHVDANGKTVLQGFKWQDDLFLSFADRSIDTVRFHNMEFKRVGE
jgi:hypothetical protein